MICTCGHELGTHSDRAVWPTCEGANERLHEPLLRVLDTNPDFEWVTTPHRLVTPPCECEGFRSV